MRKNSDEKRVKGCRVGGNGGDHARRVSSPHMNAKRTLSNHLTPSLGRMMPALLRFIALTLRRACDM